MQVWWERTWHGADRKNVARLEAREPLATSKPEPVTSYWPEGHSTLLRRGLGGWIPFRFESHQKLEARAGIGHILACLQGDAAYRQPMSWPVASRKTCPAERVGALRAGLGLVRFT
jgi:hypothetical protein